MALTLQPGVAEAIRAHGAETYPNECCGALYGRDGVVTATFALPNTTEEGPRRRFLVRPQDYRDAETARHASWAPICSGSIIRIRIIRRGRRSTISITRGRSFSYIIVSVRAGTPEDMTSWRLREDRSAFDQERLTYAEHNSTSRRRFARSPTRRNPSRSAAPPSASCSPT